MSAYIKKRTPQYQSHLEKLACMMNQSVQSVASVLEASMLITLSEAKSTGQGFSIYGTVSVDFEKREAVLTDQSALIPIIVDPQVDYEEVLESLSNVSGN